MIAENRLTSSRGDTAAPWQLPSYESSHTTVDSIVPDPTLPSDEFSGKLARRCSAATDMDELSSSLAPESVFDGCTRTGIRLLRLARSS